MFFFCDSSKHHHNQFLKVCTTLLGPWTPFRGGASPHQQAILRHQQGVPELGSSHLSPDTGMRSVPPDPPLPQTPVSSPPVLPTTSPINLLERLKELRNSLLTRLLGSCGLKGPPSQIITASRGCLTTGGPGKKPGADRLAPERDRGGRAGKKRQPIIIPLASQKPLRWKPPGLREAPAARKVACGTIYGQEQDDWPKTTRKPTLLP